MTVEPTGHDFSIDTPTAQTSRAYLSLYTTYECHHKFHTYNVQSNIINCFLKKTLGHSKIIHVFDLYKSLYRTAVHITHIFDLLMEVIQIMCINIFLFPYLKNKRKI